MLHLGKESCIKGWVCSLCLSGFRREDLILLYRVFSSSTEETLAIYFLVLSAKQYDRRYFFSVLF